MNNVENNDPRQGGDCPLSDILITEGGDIFIVINHIPMN